MINGTQSTFTLDQRSADYHLHIINALKTTITYGQHFINSSIAHDQRSKDQLLLLINALQITVTHGQRTSTIMSTNTHKSFINQQHQRSLSLQSTTSTDNT
jgi:hypothetical protein